MTGGHLTDVGARPGAGLTARDGRAVDAELLGRIYEQVEVPSWAPWLRFDLPHMQTYYDLFPEGQFARIDAEGNPVGALNTIRVSWPGTVESLITWDEVAGVGDTVSDVLDPAGNTLVLLSMGVRADRSAPGLPAALLGDARALARDEGLDHLIGPFRPSGFGAHKATAPGTPFADYCATRRDDGQLLDPWLRNLDRLGMRPLAVVPDAMVVPVSLRRFDRYRTGYHPERWFRVDDPETVARRHREHGVDEDGAELWECGETGTWYVDRAAERATYVESNLWGRLPIGAPEDQGTP